MLSRPSSPLGYLPHLGSAKVAHINIEAHGWAGTEVTLDLKLKFQDPSGAAGVHVDLIRQAAAALRRGEGGYPAAATALHKSPPGTRI